MKTKSLVLLLAVSIISGCYRINYKLGSDSDSDRPLYTTQAWNSYFVWGMIPTTPAYQAGDVCQQRRLVEMRSSLSPQNVLASIFSLNMYSASTIEAKCLR
ncbi:MAG: Bor family protein [Oligoflexia bacterium]|nr:Bor family protein [Oligoflexia bacterium]